MNIFTSALLVGTVETSTVTIKIYCSFIDDNPSQCFY